MKPRKLDKKLIVKKATIVRLDNQKMKGARGGGISRPTQCYMNTCYKTCVF